MDTKHITFTPAICKPAGDEPAAYEGSVTIRRPDYIEREELKSLTSDDEASEGDETPKKRLTPWQMMRLMAAKVPPFVVELKLKRVEDGYEFKSFEELLEDSEAGSVAVEICSKLVAKYRVGKGQTPS